MISRSRRRRCSTRGGAFLAEAGCVVVSDPDPSAGGGGGEARR